MLPKDDRMPGDRAVYILPGGGNVPGTTGIADPWVQKVACRKSATPI